MDFKSRLKYLRELRGLTQKQFAEEFNKCHIENNIGDDTNVYVQTVSYWENGREPSYSVLIKLAHFFNVSTDYLIGNSNITDVKEFEYISNIKELNKENINKVISNLDDTGKSEFFESLSRYIYNLRLNTALIENRALSKNDLDYIKFLSAISSIIDNYTEELFNVFIEFKNEAPKLKKNLIINEFKQITLHHTDAMTEFATILNDIQELCLKIIQESDDIKLKR